VELAATVDQGRVRYARGAPCGGVPLDRAAADQRLALLRRTGAKRVLLAPEPAATLTSVVDVLLALSEEITTIRQEEWDRSCPPPAHCEPYVAWETGVPLVWLTADRAALEPG
jgi:hypothetical protein